MSGCGPWKMLHDVSTWQVGHPRGKLVLIAIATSANSEEREGFMALRSIATFAEISISQARNWIRKLEDAGWLKTEPRFKHGRQTSNIYQIIGEGTKLAEPKEQEGARTRGRVQPRLEGGEGEALGCRGEGEALGCRGEDKKEDKKEVPLNPQSQKLTPELRLELPTVNAPENAAVLILAHLNSVTGSKFRPVAATLDPICARLREPGVDVAGVLKMIDRQVARWRGTEMEQYLRPSTLFRASKFNEYYAAKDQPVASRSLRPQSIVQRDQHIMDGGSGSFADMTVEQCGSLDALVNR